METVKNWILKIGLEKAVPALAKSGISAAVLLLAAQSGKLAHWGIALAGHTLTVDLDQVGVGTAALAVGVLTSALEIGTHHGKEMMKKLPIARPPKNA